ncbi:MAG: hypothetical protein INQ03_02730 [Candidatus Heimdallarchaeota archaeon]|nr:hypothetical protein [Candidatus Heimdallarchaeota archaeon]
MSEPDLSEIIAVLLAIKHSSAGRYTLARRTGLTEARIRVVTDFLRDQKLIYVRSGRAGMILEPVGEKFVKKIRTKILANFDNDLFDLPNSIYDHKELGPNYCSIALSADDIDTSGIRVRDIAIREGAKAAITLVKKMNWHIPPEEIPVVKINFKQSLPPQFNMIITVFGDNSFHACLKGALYHLDAEFDNLEDF